MARIAAPLAALLAFLLPALSAAAEPLEVLRARQVVADVDRGLARMETATFTAQRRAVEYRTEARAWRDALGVRKVEATDRDDDGDVVTLYYYDGSELAFAYQAVKRREGSRQVTSVEQRQYFRGGRMAVWLGGLERAVIPPSDPSFAPEGAERLSAAAFFRDAARLAFDKQDRDTVTLVSMEPGDVACYLRVRDERGAEATRLADFEVCEMKPSPVGQRVRMESRAARVMADECQGDTGCGKTREVALVVALRVLGPGSPAQAARAVPQRSFCTDLETAVFACRAGAMLASICVSKDAARDRGYVQYRLGKPDSREPLAVMAPESRLPPSRAATGANVAFSGGGGSWLRLRAGDSAYVAYSGIGRWGPRGETREKQGVLFERGGKVVSHVRCTERYETLPDRDWYERMGIADAGGDFEFPD